MESAPGTPWDKEMRALEKKEHDGYNQAAVSTPSQQKDFLARCAAKFKQEMSLH